MKNRFLPFAYLNLFVGFVFLSLSFQSLAESPGSAVIIKRSKPFSAKSTDDHLIQMRANQNTGNVDPVDVIRAKEQIYRLSAKSSPALDLNWISLGPNNVAGRSRAVLYDKKDPNGQTIYTGGVTGGIWKSTNSGLTWDEQNTGNNEVLRVTCLVQTPNGDIYAGTGESFCNTDHYVGTGLYRSTDGVTFNIIPDRN